MEAAGDEQAGEGLDEVVEVARGAVVETAGELNIVLHGHEGGAELTEIFVGLQVGVGLGDGEQGTEILGKAVLGHTGGGQALGGLGGGTFSSDGGQDVLFMGAVALDAFNKVGDEVVPAFELNIHPAPGFTELVAGGDEPVESPDRVNHGHGHQTDHRP